MPFLPAIFTEGVSQIGQDLRDGISSAVGNVNSAVGAAGRFFGDLKDNLAIAKEVSPRAKVNGYVGEWLDNLFTGNRDFNRNVQLMDHQAELNNAAAERDFERSMEASNTAVQRAAADYKAAGLNPALALGAAASAPSMSTSGVGLNNAGRSGDKALSALLTVVGALIASNASMVNATSAANAKVQAAALGANNAASAESAALARRDAERYAWMAVRDFKRR